MKSGEMTEKKEGTVPSHILEEISGFEAEIGRLRRGEIPDEKFKRFRLQQGIYGQRQKDDFMVRVKIPQGTLNPIQMRLLADIGDTYSNSIAHTSTRQDIQFHWVKLENVPTIMRQLAGAGLTTREACGNTVRNVTGCYIAGICPDEVFDISPYAIFTTRYLLRNAICQSLPRKFKIAFSGCEKDCAMAPINDIGAISVTKNIGGVEQQGFKIYIAGGLGPHPRIAQLFSEFVPLEDFIPLTEAILRVFDQFGERKNRNRSRLKFLLEKIGFDELKARILKEFNILKSSKEWSYTLPSGETLSDFSGMDEYPSGSSGVTADYADIKGNGDPYFYRWLGTNVIPQKQKGYSAVSVRLVLGDITTEQLRKLADMTAEYANSRIKVTQQQNFLLRWVQNKDVYTLYKGLKDAGLALAGAHRTIDIQSCPGAETCNLGLTSSRQLAAAITRELSTRDDAETEAVRVKVSGCPNSCGHHHIADIGFHGVAKKIEGKLVPHYQLHLKGGVGNGRAVVGDSNIKLPARNIPKGVSELISKYQREKVQDEPFYQYVERVGLEYIQEFLEKYTTIPSYAESPESYSDWGSSSEFVVKLGAGECAGGVVDLIEDSLMAGGREASRAEMLLGAGQVEEALKCIDSAVIFVAQGMLVPFGIDTEVEVELVREFQDKVIDKCIVSEKVEPLFVEYGKPAAKDKVKEKVALAHLLVDESLEAYSKLDKNFKFKKREEKAKE